METTLLEQVQTGDEGALRELLDSHRGLVLAVRRKHFPRASNPDDLVEAGKVGLWKAATSYDADKGTFPSYAWVHIKAEMAQVEAESHPGHSLSYRDARKLRRLKSVPLDTPETMAKAAGITEEDAVVLMPLVEGATAPLDAELENSLSCGTDEQSAVEAAIMAEELLSHLDLVEEFLVRRVLMDGANLQEAANALGISRQAAHQRLSRIIKKLQEVAQ